MRRRSLATRTPLGRSVVALAAVQAARWQRSVRPAVIRAERAQSRDGGRVDASFASAPRPLSRRALLLGGGAAVAWTIVDAARLAAAQAPASKKTAPRKPTATVA